jgi:hypothetical protein
MGKISERHSDFGIDQDSTNKEDEEQRKFFQPV